MNQATQEKLVNKNFISKESTSHFNIHLGTPGQRGTSGEKGDRGDVGPQGYPGNVGPAGAPVRLQDFLKFLFIEVFFLLNRVVMVMMEYRVKKEQKYIS